MTDPISENQTYKNQDFTKNNEWAQEYNECVFQGCNLSNCNLSDLAFFDCQFMDCNLSMIQVKNTSFKETNFSNCKIIGVDFSQCNDFLLSFQFENSQLDYTFFYKKKLKKIIFKNCSLKEANFTDTDLSGASFLNCNLERAIFDRTSLIHADFRTAYNYSIDPEINFIKKARFTYPSLLGLLGKYEIQVE